MCGGKRGGKGTSSVLSPHGIPRIDPARDLALPPPLPLPLLPRKLPPPLALLPPPLLHLR